MLKHTRLSKYLEDAARSVSVSRASQNMGAWISGLHFATTRANLFVFFFSLFSARKVERIPGDLRAKFAVSWSFKEDRSREQFEEKCLTCCRHRINIYRCLSAKFRLLYGRYSLRGDTLDVAPSTEKATPKFSRFEKMIPYGRQCCIIKSYLSRYIVCERTHSSSRTSCFKDRTFSPNSLYASDKFLALILRSL